MSLSKECVSGVLHEGSATGKSEEINGVNTYIALPSGDFPKDKAILFLTDVFGLQLNNNKLLVDDFARNGFQTYMPDLFNGEPYPEDFLTRPPGGFDRAKWQTEHSIEISRVIVNKTIAGLRERGITTFGAVGYCYSAKHIIDLAKDNAIASAAIAHPGRNVTPEEFHHIGAKSKAPLLINSCEIDSAFPPEVCQQADEILGNGKYKPGYSREHWMGCTHGFAVRGDMSNPQVKAGKEGAFKATVGWFLKM